MKNLKNPASLILLALGFAAVCFALAVSGEAYSAFLLGEKSKDLSWGVPLFRALLLFHGILLIGIAVFREKFAEKESLETDRAEKTEKAEKTPFITRFEFAILSVLTVIALVLRFWNLNSDLWVDEVFTLVDFVRMPFGEMLTSFPSQNQHLLFSILAHASTSIFGESAWSVRLPSVLFGAASIWAFFLLCKKLLGSREALLGAVLMTVSYHHIWFSQNARGYMGLLFFTLLATFFWFEALEKNTWKLWLAYAAAIVFGMWIHMTMAFVVAAHGLVYLSFWLFPNLGRDESKSFPIERRAGLKPFAAWFLSVTVTTQLYALALPEFLSRGLHEESNNSEWTNPVWVLTETLRNLSIGFAGIAVVAVGAAFVAFGWWKLFEKNRRAAILMVLPPVFAGSLMLALGHNLFPRFFFFAMGFGLLIVIHGAFELPKFLMNKAGAVLDRFEIQNPKSKIQNPVGISLVLLIIAASLITVPRNYALPKQNFTGAKNFVESRRLPDEKVVAVNIAGDMYGRYFAPEWSVAKTTFELENLEQKAEKIWLVYTLSPEIKAFRPELWQMIEKDYQIVQIFPGTLSGGEIYVCRKRNTSEENDEASRKNEKSSENLSVRQTALVK